MKHYMNTFTGSVDILENWISDTSEQEIQKCLEDKSLIEVKKDEDGNWIEA